MKLHKRYAADNHHGLVLTRSKKSCFCTRGSANTTLICQQK